MKDKTLTKRMRNKMVIDESMKGASNGELAAKYCVSEARVGQIINHSDEAIDIHNHFEMQFRQRIHKAFFEFDKVLEQDDDTPSKLKAAMHVFERVAGKVPDKLHAVVQDIGKMSEDELIMKVEEKLNILKAKRLNDSKP